MAPEKSAEPVYRLFNTSNGQHILVHEIIERSVLIGLGWKEEGIAFYSSIGSNKKAVYRLYNPNNGQHFFTTNAGERNSLTKLGWRYEGIDFWGAG